MKRVAAALLLAAVAIGLFASPARTAAPKPAAATASWQLDIDIQKPKAIRIKDEAGTRVYWYMVYKVSNHTGADQLFVPEFTLYTSTGQSLTAGRGVPVDIYGVIKKTVNNPLLRDSISMAGKLLQGDDNAKTGVAIWPDFDFEAGKFKVFIGGLSGETAALQLEDGQKVEVHEADVDEKVTTVQKDRIILSKTLELDYSIPGEAASRVGTEVTLDKKDWVMR